MFSYWRKYMKEHGREGMWTPCQAFAGAGSETDDTITDEQAAHFLGTRSLMLSVLSVICGMFLIAPVALIAGIAGILSAARARSIAKTGRAAAGLILGIAGVALSVVDVVMWFSWMQIAFGMMQTMMGSLPAM